MTLDLPQIRGQFPALAREAAPGVPVVFFDNPGGSQISRPSLERVQSYYLNHNANHGAASATSKESDAILDDAHRAMADFLNAARPEEIIFGNNMTTLTLYISRSIARTWNPGDTIVVTRLDHDANVTPWVLAAQDRGVNVLRVNFNLENGTLDMEDLARALESKPRLVAVGYASNALGTINPVARIVQMAHAVGAQVYVDAVQYAAHGPIDVQQLGCEFLVTSSYKFFGPHAGILYGRYDVLDGLFAYKVRPATNDLPGRLETGTQNHEGIAGVLGALEYLEWVGESFGAEYAQALASRYNGRRLRLKQSLSAIRQYEFDVSRAVLQVLTDVPGLNLYGPRDPDRLDERVPTFSFTLPGWHPRQLAETMAAEGIYVYDGNYYALQVTEAFDLEGKGGMIRVGPVHYNTLAEVERFAESLHRLARRGP